MSRIRASFSVLAVVFIFFALPCGAHAQTQFGSVVGHATDPSGAPVPGVAVYAANEASSLGFSTVTGASGVYVIGGLLPGTYTITGQKSGFKRFSIRGVAVSAGQSARADIHLSLGGTVETVTVSASASPLNTESGTVVNSAPAAYLAHPATIMPASQTLSDTLVPYLPGQTYTGGRQISAYGSRTYDRRVTLDGAVFGLQNTSGLRMPRGSIQELISSSLNANADQQTSNTTEMITTKGTNDLHGAIWSEYQNQALNASEAIAPAPPSPGIPIVGFGFILGGPVYIPKLYNGRNKTFFHVTFQKYHFVIPLPAGSTMPTDAMRNGDLSEQKIQIVDPSTGQPFPNETIPSSRISPIATNILNQFYPKIGQGPFSLNDFPVDTNYTSPWLDTFIRLDQQIGNGDSLSVSYLYNHITVSDIPNAVSAAISGPATPGFTTTQTTANYINISENHIFGPTVLNEMNFGVLMGPGGSTTNAMNGETVLKSMGLPTTPNAPAGITGGPSISISGISGLGWGNQSSSGRRIYTVRDTVSWTRGRSTSKVGFELVRPSSITRTNYSNLFGTYSFTGQFTGSGFGDFLLGLPSNTTRNLPPGPLGLTQHQLGFFGTEALHLTSKLTLNFGLRIEYDSPPIEPSGKYYNFDLRNGNLVVPSQSSLNALNPGLSPELLADIVTASSAGFPSKLVNGLLNVNPRFGFAYRLARNTVVRGGYGRYGTLLASGAPTGGPFTPGVQNFTNTNTCNAGSCVPSFTLANPFPGTGTQAVSGLSVSGVNPNLRDPVTAQWNLTVEHRLPASFVLRASYAGSESTQLPFRRNVNLPPASTIPFTQSRLLYPQWFSVTYADSGGNQSYEALDTELKKTWGNGLSLDEGYTWSKCLTDVNDGGVEVTYGTFGALGPTIEDPYDRARDKGNCEAIPRHSFRTILVYNLPFGTGQHWLSSVGGHGQGIVNAILGGWTFSGFMTARSGHFYTPFWSGFDAPNTGQTFLRPDRICSGQVSKQAQYSLFNPACFVQPPLGSYGNAGMGIIQGLGFWRFDAGIYKTFTLARSERVPKLRISATSMNLFNHPTYDAFGTGPFVVNNPVTAAINNSTPYDSGVTANKGPQRQIFLEARLEW